jgi:hypothetical protein
VFIYIGRRGVFTIKLNKRLLLLFYYEDQKGGEEMSFCAKFKNSWKGERVRTVSVFRLQPLGFSLEMTQGY